MSEFYSHPTAIVETDQIGEGTRIWAYSHVMKNVIIGSNCNIGDHCFFEPGVIIGNNVTIKNGNMLFDGVILEDGVFVGPHVFFTNDLYPRSPRLPQAKKRYESNDWLHKTVVKYGATLGAGTIIIAGHTLGEFCMIGAGSVVTHDIIPYALVIGNPARRVGWVCQCGLKLKQDGQNATCPSCHLNYIIDNERLRPA